ncbi:MAG: hypothetical protein U0P30_17350 [Vicinamibacterales bacterium]
MANELSKDDLRRFARLGAMRRLEDIRREEAAIRAAFPELFEGSAPRRATAPAAPAKAAKKAAKAGRKRSNMSPAMRKAVSERMKKYWAGRRKAKAEKNG